MKKISAFFLVMLTVLSMLCACSYQSDSDSDSVSENFYSMHYEKMSSSIASFDKSERKYSFSGSVWAETKNYPEVYSKLTDRISADGAYIQTSDIYGDVGHRSAILSVMIPRDKFAEFIEYVKSIANVTDISTCSEDVTDDIISYESELDSLSVQQERLLEMLKNTSDIDTLIKLEDKLAQVRKDIAYFDNMLKIRNNSVEYSSIFIELSEVNTYTENQQDDFSDRISEAFASSWDSFISFCKDLAVFVVGSLPFIIVIVIAAVIIAVICKKNRKKIRERVEKQRSDEKINNSTEVK